MSSNELNDFVDRIVIDNLKREIHNNKKIAYYDVPCAFDIETSSFTEDDEKRGIMYEWTFGIDGILMYGRTWESFVAVLNRISYRLWLSDERRLIIYVHNLSFEFQFLCHWFEWANVFASDERKPIYALTTSGIEFRCSYFLSGRNLEKVGEDLQKYKCKKLVGDLDYSLIRHSETELTNLELWYCYNDVMTVICYIQEEIDHYGDITKIPLTKTGKVRKFCRDATIHGGDTSHRKESMNAGRRYREMIKDLTMTVDDYKQFKRCFQGGFTHANAYYTGKTVKDVASLDLTSSYPTVMVSCQFPMSAPIPVEDFKTEPFEYLINNYCCIFDVELHDVQASTIFDHPISLSKCYEYKNVEVDNGRIVSADMIRTTVTEQDYFIYKDFYTWSDIKIANFKKFYRSYLPKSFVTSILKLYGDKTSLKGIPERQVDYMLSKELVNSCYGMTVTDPCKDVNSFTDQWNHTPVDIDKAIEKYNKAFQRFLYYPWGIFVTAYARRRLFMAIKACGTDYVYSDTDSVKIRNYESHKAFFERFNEWVTKQCDMAMDYHELPRELTRPKTIKGIEKPLGVFDYEETYKEFKTLGAKRYLVRSEDGSVHLTVAGLSKSKGCEYLVRTYGDKVFDAFDDNLHIPETDTGKLIHAYIDFETEGDVTDYTGKTTHYHELSSVNLSPTSYDLSIVDEYINYCLGIQDELI